MDVGEHCDQDQVFVEDDLAGTVFSITEGAGVYVPNIGHILPVQGDTTYTVRMVITPESMSGWNRIPNVNHGADHGLYINGGTQIYPDGQGGADNYPAGEWSSLTVVTDTGGNAYTYYNGELQGSWQPVNNWATSMQITSDEMLFFNDYDQEHCNSGGEHTNFLLKSIQI